MHLLIPIGIAIGVAIWAKTQCKILVFFIASIAAAVLIGMEIQEGIDE